jgi:hypothetical protein
MRNEGFTLPYFSTAIFAVLNVTNVTLLHGFENVPFCFIAWYTAT